MASVKRCSCGGAFVYQYASNKVYRTYCEACGKSLLKQLEEELVPEKLKKRTVIWLWLTNFWRKNDDQ